MSGSIASFLRDVARPLQRRPGFMLLVCLMLALGIASTTAVFSIVRGVLLTPPPYAEPERLAFVATARAEDRDTAGIFNWPEQMWEEWLVDAETLHSVAGYRWAFNYLVLDDGSEPLEGMMVSEDFLAVLGIEPEIGRGFVAADMDGSQNQAVILGYDLWMRRFDGDPGIIGQTVRLAGPATTVIGVMPPGLRFLPSPNVSSEPNYDLHGSVEFWLPIPPQFRDRPAWNVVARLNPGVTPSEAEAEIAVLLAQQAAVVPELQGLGARLEPLLAMLNAEARQLLVPLFAAAALVLLIAAGNATALLLIHGLRRQHEFGLRSAIGAGGRRLFSLVVAESLVLAVVSSAVGFVLALALVRLLEAAAGSAIPRLEDVTIGWSVLGFGFAVACIACVVAALAPALRAASLDPVDALRMGGPKSSGNRSQQRVLTAVVVGQTALTLALLVGAGLLIRTTLNVESIRPGYETRNILTMSVTVLDGGYDAFHASALERVAELPGVEAAAFAWGVPLTGNAWPSRIEIDGYSPADSENTFVALPMRAVTSGYFDLMGQSVMLGRDFRITDNPDAQQVAIVNERFVERYFDGGSAIGRTLWPRGRDNGPPAEIVGVIGDTRTHDLTQEAEPEVYLPLWQARPNSKHLVLRSTAPPEATAASVQRVLRDISPTVALENVRTLEEIRGKSLASRHFATQLLIGFAVVACMLTLGGVYSVLSLSVATRRREIAIRSAIGAGRGTVLRHVMRQGMRMIVGGAIGGLLAAVALSSLLEAWLFGVAATDFATLAITTLLFVAIAAIACWAPAYRATQIEPVEVLKSD